MSKLSMMERLGQRARPETALLVIIVIMSASTFFFFKSFFDSTAIDGFTIEILAALLGTIFTVMITMLLIRHQGTVERSLKLAATSKNIVFERKLELFKEFISVYTKSAADGKLSQKELGRLEELALTISLFTRDVPVGPGREDLGEEVCRFVLQLELFGLREALQESEHQLYDRTLAYPDQEKSPERRLMSLVDILRLMRIDLGVAQSDDDEVDEELSDLEQYEWTRRLLRYRGHSGERVKPGTS